MIMKNLHRLFGLTTVIMGLAAVDCMAEKTLEVRFDGAKEVAVGNETVKVDGNFKDGLLAIGEDAVSFPAKPLFGEDSGTILFDCVFDEPREPFNTMRPLVTLRTKGRLSASFYFFSNKSLLFNFTDQSKRFLHQFKDKLVPGRNYRMALTWDGSRMKIYMDGKAVADGEQPIPFNGRMSKLNIGPYADSYYVTKKWTNDAYIKYIMTDNKALSSVEIAALCGVELKPLVETHPMTLTVPPIAAGTPAPTLDGRLDEKAWSYAASMPRLIQGNFPRLSGELPPHDFRMTYDKDTLYVGFTTLFPPNAPLVEGELRTPEKEPEAWGTESFEFYIEGDNRYRFAGNVAGGYCEGKPHEAKWNGEWTYRTSQSRNIDDTILWQGEIAIPWRTIGLDGPPKAGSKFNFCRSWKIPQAGNFSSLNVTGGGYVPEAMIEARFAPTPTMRVLKQNNPNSGEYEMEFNVASVAGGKAEYELAIARLDGSTAPIPLNTKSWSLKAGEVVTDKQIVQISLTDYDCLLYTLKDGARVVMREIIPFKLDEDFFAVQPYFLHGHVRILLKDVMMRNKLGSAFKGRITLAAKGAEGKELASIATDDAKMELPFDRKLPGGKYVISLADAKGAVQASKEVFYPGIEEWESMEFPMDVIIPPFKPMTNTVKGTSLKSEFSCRTYSWDCSALPVSMVGNGEELMSAAPQILIGGKAAKTETFKVDSAAAHRVEFSAAGMAGASTFKSSSWLEYDGIQWNDVELAAGADGGTFALRFEFGAEQAKFLHCAGSGHWGHKITRAVAEGVSTVQFYPVIWLGNEERGLCFFVEGHSNWNVPSKRTYTIEKKDGKVVLTVNIAEKLKAGANEKFSFGLIGTPVRPYADNYPFDTFGWGYNPPMNRPGRRPTSDVVLINYPAGMKAGNLGAVFADCDDADGHARAAAYSYALENMCKGHNVRPIPYICGHFVQDRYPEMRAYRAEWCFSPEIAMDYDVSGDIMYDCCPASSASSFICWRIQELLKRYPDMKGIYFDFGNIDGCSNEAHGCHGGTPLLAQRDFYRKVALVQYRLGIKSPVVAIHNTDCNMFPTYTFVSHLLNGEHLRQQSSTTFHNKKDILDTYGIEMFASELSTLPIGVTNSVYMPLDTLMAKYGGDEETEPYQFRMGKAEHAATLIHNTIICLFRNHFGTEDKIIRVLDRFGADKAKFVGYWRRPATVTGADDIYVSCHVKDGKVLAVVSHVGKPHVNQTFDITFDWKKLGISEPPVKAVDTMTADDPEYAELFKRRAEFKVPPTRAPLELGDFGSKVISFKDGVLRMSLEFHSFALVELTK